MDAMITPLFKRVTSKFLIGDGCWEWISSLDHNGYPMFWEKNANTGGKSKAHLGHRLVYELLVGPIPDGLVIDHLCRNSKCVRPDHLEPVPQRVNVARGNASESAYVRWQHRLATVTKCRNGHEFTPENTYLQDGRIRRCRTCNRDKMRVLRGKAQKAAFIARFVKG